MDPHANLQEQVALAREIQNIVALGMEPAQHLTDRLVELVLALAEWRSKGGFAPAGTEVPQAIETDDDAIYHPWTDGYAVGYRVERPSTGEAEYIYFNPSSDDDEGQPNVFVYQGPHGDPARDTSQSFYNVLEGDE